VKIIKKESAISSKDTNDLESSNKTIFESDSAFLRKMTYYNRTPRKMNSEDILNLDENLKINDL